MSTSTKTPSLYAKWLERALELKTGQILYIQLETREEQKQFFNGLQKELRLLKKLAPIEANSIVAGKIFKDSRFWVFLKRTQADQYVGFLKDNDGSISRVYLPRDDNRLRRLQLMVFDGWTREKILKTETYISVDEQLSLWPNETPIVISKE